ncbi:putative leader peptide [Micromonospora sp. C51]|uniref:putative leader peptide n=1 Tax=Micromonospora sp. C51 TaxID=2824879 RepID=UPI0035B4B80F
MPSGHSDGPAQDCSAQTHFSGGCFGTVNASGRPLTGCRIRSQHGCMSRRDELLLTARVHVDLVRHASALC